MPTFPKTEDEEKFHHFLRHPLGLSNLNVRYLIKRSVGGGRPENVAFGGNELECNKICCIFQMARISRK